MYNTQLLCTFSHTRDLELTTDYIQTKYTVPERRIFVFKDKENPSDLFCTYNAEVGQDRGKNTISIHRKKDSNTLYTVNALNAVIRSMNNGIVDKTFIVPWINYSNSFILTEGDDFYVVNLVLYRKVSW